MQGPKLEPNRRPRPMPGRFWPTHVAWSLRITEYFNGVKNGLVVKSQPKIRTLTYIGKPALYRALQARKFLATKPHPNATNFVLEMWQAEFDRNGLVAYKIYMGKPFPAISSGAFWAYHPHSTQVDIVEAFCRPVHIKYIGGMRVYSQKSRLTQEAVDAYYDWYKQQFGRRLKRPKAIPTAIIGGQQVEFVEEPQQ